MAVHTARHKERWAPRRLAKPTSLARCRSQGDTSKAVKADQGRQGSSLSSLAQILQRPLGKKREQLLQAAASELMEIRVPRGDQRNAQSVSHPRAELAELTRAGYVNDIGAKLQNGSTHVRKVAPQEEVVAQVVLDAKAGPTAREFQARDVPFLKFSDALTALYCQQRKRPALGEGHELSSGQRDSIDFMERLAEQRDSRLRGHKPPSSLPKNATLSAGRT
jgi:hypothetical protein